MKKIRITELLIMFNNSPGNQVIELGVLEGDFNTVNPMFYTYTRSLDKQKSDYIFKVEYDGKISYRFNLDNIQLVKVSKLIPGING